MAHPLLYREHKFRVASVLDIQGVPRDIERLSFVQKQGSRWKEMNSLLNDFSSLTSLNLGFNRIGPEGAASLANSPNLASLTSLNLDCNLIGDEGAASLANSANLASLTSLDLKYNQIGDEGAARLANSTNLTSLISLDLEYNQIGFEGAALFKKILFERMSNCKVHW